jgi:signal peptide peptidase SppA
MSEQIARNALARMNLREQAICESYQGFAGDLTMMARAIPADMQEKFMNETRHELCEAYGYSRREQTKPFAFANGFAIIPIHGSLINRFGASYGYVTGYNFIRAQHNAAMMDPDVKYIVHDHNSYGGEAAGCFELADDIYNSRGTKPIIAVVDSNSYSASFALSTSTDKIFVTPSSGVGSVGVVAMHVDMSKMLDNIGVKITFIHSGDHKVDGNPYEALSPEVKADIKKGIDKSRTNFVALVARNLGLDSKVVYDTEARTYRADDALKLGLVHVIAVPSAALQSLIDDDAAEADESDENLSTVKEQENMSTETTAPAPVVAPAASAAPAAAAAPVISTPVAAADNSAEARTAERARISGILGCAEAKSNHVLATHLAMNTSMSLVDAQATLAAAGPAAAAAPAAPTANAFETAMNNTAQPQIGPDGATVQPGGKESASASILADYARVTGAKLTEK